jgi:hypothetical protein
MGAGLVAFATDVNLECAEFAPAEGQPMPGQFGFKAIHASGVRTPAPPEYSEDTLSL